MIVPGDTICAVRALDAQPLAVAVAAVLAAAAAFLMGHGYSAFFRERLGFSAGASSTDVSSAAAGASTTASGSAAAAFSSATVASIAFRGRSFSLGLAAAAPAFGLLLCSYRLELRRLLPLGLLPGEQDVIHHHTCERLTMAGLLPVARLRLVLEDDDLGARPCSSIVPSTRAPLMFGAPTVTAPPSAISSTSPSSTVSPTSPGSRSTLSARPSSTRYCFPPVRTTAYTYPPDNRMPAVRQAPISVSAAARDCQNRPKSGGIHIVADAASPTFVGLPRPSSVRRAGRSAAVAAPACVRRVCPPGGRPS